jgi:hypothetical protein
MLAFAALALLSLIDVQFRASLHNAEVAIALMETFAKAQSVAVLGHVRRRDGFGSAL